MCTTMPLGNDKASTRLRCREPGSWSNRGRPWPRTSGWTRRRYSLIRSAAARAPANRPPPHTITSGPGTSTCTERTSPCALLPLGLQRPFQPVERVRHTPAVLVAQLVGRETPLDHRHQGRPVPGRERELGAEGEPG